MPNLDYAFHHIECVASIIVGRSEALDRMDITADGFWRSFSAIIVALPAMFFIWVINARLLQAESPGASVAAIVAGEAILDLTIWLLPIGVFALVLGPLGMAHRFAHLVILRNWSTALFSYVIALPFLPYLLMPQGNAVLSLIGVIVIIATFMAAVRLTRVALDTSMPIALAFVSVELVAGLLLVGLYAGIGSPG